jgi:CheY-like chemotaxis protein
VNLLILVVDDEPDVEALFRQQFRRELRADRFAMEFAQSASMALQRITNAGGESLILILSDINMPGERPDFSVLTHNRHRRALPISL